MIDYEQTSLKRSYTNQSEESPVNSDFCLGKLLKESSLPTVITTS